MPIDAIREKTTDSLVFILLADGEAINLTNVNHVELHMLDASNKTYRYSSLDTSPYVSVYVASEGKVTFTPPDENVFLYRKSPYKLYWQVWNTATEKYSVPEDSSYELKILKEY